jgi:hypothetical protein
MILKETISGLPGEPSESENSAPRESYRRTDAAVYPDSAEKIAIRNRLSVFAKEANGSGLAEKIIRSRNGSHERDSLKVIADSELTFSGKSLGSKVRSQTPPVQFFAN